MTDFTFVEDWENDALLEAHLASAYIEETDVMNGLVAKPDICFYRLLG
ncbi:MULTISPECIES: hypothetical protein [Cyanophyceae]